MKLNCPLKEFFHYKNLKHLKLTKQLKSIKLKNSYFLHQKFEFKFSTNLITQFL